MQKTVSIIKKHKFLSTLFIIIVVACAWWAIFTYMPHPLGDKMEYLGKHDFGALFLGDDTPYSVYYYGTNIEPDDMAQYFTDTTLKRPIENKGSYTDVWLLHNDVTIYLTYEKFRPTDIKSTNKKYLIAISSDDYSVLKSLAR